MVFEFEIGSPKEVPWPIVAPLCPDAHGTLPTADTVSSAANP